jgi:signal transduction histidine kinase
MLVAFRHSDEQCSTEVAVLNAVIGCSALAYSIQLGSGSVAAQTVWWRLSFLCSIPVPLLWLVFVARYVGRSRWLTRRRIGMLAVEPVAVAIAAVTNPIHGLVWTISSTPVAPSTAIDIAFGPLYYGHLALNHLAVVIGVSALLLVGVRRSLVYWKQATLLAAAPIPPFAANIAFLFGSSPVPNVDLTPFVFTFTGGVVVFSLYWSDLLERTPIARRTVLDVMGDGLVTLDSEGVVVSADDTALRVLDPPPVVGDPIGRTFPDRSLAEIDDTTVVDEHNLVYDIRVSELADERGDEIGHAIVLRDITARHRYQQRLEVANRVLRHNLRNDMNVVRGYAETVASGVTDDAERAANAILDRTDELLTVGEKARKVSELDDSHAQAPTRHDITELVAGIVHRTAREYPNTAVSIDGTAGAEAQLTDSGSVGTAIREVIELLVAQAEGEEITIRVAVTCEDDAVAISFDSTGPGIPAVEREALTAGSESPLQHADGLGLWLAYWCIIENGGTLNFEPDASSRANGSAADAGGSSSNDPERTAVVFRFSASAE